MRNPKLFLQNLTLVLPLKQRLGGGGGEGCYCDWSRGTLFPSVLENYRFENKIYFSMTCSYPKRRVITEVTFGFVVAFECHLQH